MAGKHKEYVLQLPPNDSRFHHRPVLWRLSRSGSKHHPDTGLNANTVLCNQQAGDDVTDWLVTGTAHRSHECTVTAQKGALQKSAHAELFDTDTDPAYYYEHF